MFHILKPKSVMHNTKSPICGDKKERGWERELITIGTIPGNIDSGMINALFVHACYCDKEGIPAH